MTSRPQFSLRRLLLVTLFVCLAAATLNEPPESQRVVRGAQAFLRAALCVTFAAVLTVGALRSDGYRKSFHIGGACAAALPLLVLVETIAGLDPGLLIGVLSVLSGVDEAAAYRWWFAISWAAMPGFGLAAVGFDWLLRVGAVKNGRHTLQTRQRVVRGALFVVLASCLAVIAAMPASVPRTLTIMQSWLAQALCIFFVAAMVVGTIQGSGRFKMFCVGGLLPSVLAVVWVYVWALLDQERHRDRAENFVQWVTSFVFDEGLRLILAAHWALIPVLGAAFVFCDWLLKRGTSGPKSE